MDFHHLPSCRSPGAPWLNPPPHPITVYASHPPSPTTAQHSLPGGALLPYRGRSFTGRNASASPAAPATSERMASTSKPTNRPLRSVVNSGNRPCGFYQEHYRGVVVAKSALEVSSPVAKASAAALISDCACARATAARAVASPVCAEVASVNVPTPCA